MINWIKIINGKWIKDIIDNFDPFGIKALIDIELNEQHNENQKLNNKEK